VVVYLELSNNAVVIRITHIAGKGPGCPVAVCCFYAAAPVIKFSEPALFAAETETVNPRTRVAPWLLPAIQRLIFSLTPPFLIIRN
jgi:hypothetical protein